MSVMIFNHGGGGASSLSVKAFSAVGNLPSSASAGDIALITALSVGEAYAGADAPASPSAGTVWVWTGSKSLQTIPLTNTITLFPRAVYRWSGSAWVLLTSYVYSGTVWKEISLSIYDAGSEILCATEAGSSRGGGTACSFTEQSAAVYINKPTSDWAYRVYRTAVAIDLTDITTIKITYTKSADLLMRLLIGTASTMTSDTCTAYADGATGTVVTKTLDVSAYNGLYYVGVECGCWNSVSGTGYLYKLELIK